MNITPKLREQLLESARLSGEWYVNTQNNEQHPWGGVHDSADVGRFLYEYYPATKWCRGAGVWAQGVGIMGLMTLARRKENVDYAHWARLAGGYLKSLQILNPSDEKCHGALRERTPQCDWCFPRDAATGGLGLCCLYRETREEEYLHRARLFGEWYHRHGSDAQGWPHAHYDFTKRQGSNLGYQPGNWQAGGGLFYYWLHRQTGEKQWLDYLRPLMDRLVAIHEEHVGDPVLAEFHGKAPISYGNDDFAIVTLIAAYRHWGEPRMLAAVNRYLRRLWTLRDEDGSYPSFEGAFVSTIDNLDYLELCREKGLEEDLDELERSILQTTRFGLTLQETSPADLRSYGGFYGETNYGVSRDRISHRGTGYAMLMNLRLIGGVETPYYSSFGW